MTNEDIILANRLAEAAGEAIRPFFRARFERETKADASPVTEADRAAEAAMRAIINAERPADGIIGEEYGREREDAARVWVLDPIDGTRAFVAGRPLFGTLIALVEEDQPVLGVIDQPIARDRWVGARGQVTSFNGVPARTRRCSRLGDAHIGTTSPAAFPASDYARFQKVSAKAGDTLWGGDCHNYGLAASGHLDAVIEAGLQLYDFAALIPVVEGAGGKMTDWQGRPLDARSPGQVIAAGDPALIDQIAALLN
ncbi:MULTISPECIES: histidinol-phosphatase [unclassified Sphingomonas]|uniref:histidinol-phosphatase n=1 Tax=unclassified Sphingomonas TaxID=196159 RepID=UPI0006F39753|nr:MULTISPECIES: histidinol-phosphatase [unclassified Sphingomonas]KQX20860.1 histidinol phosphate phosphatase [Sphingomonas sp. Root1294]KQY68706.1 histidinol phosphate phosphatase [Sphingomonas sp. Root50]KRB88110.1 histidinol phosphate phosphatase [Sphingomonas sp. Root720]